jgi:hypothetical protein
MYLVLVLQVRSFLDPIAIMLSKFALTDHMPSPRLGTRRAPLAQPRDEHHASPANPSPPQWGESGEITGGNGPEWRGTGAGPSRLSITSAAPKRRSHSQLLAAIPPHAVPCGGAIVARRRSLQNRYSPVRFRPAPLGSATTYDARWRSITAVGQFLGRSSGETPAPELPARLYLALCCASATRESPRVSRSRPAGWVAYARGCSALFGSALFT